MPRASQVAPLTEDGSTEVPEDVDPAPPSAQPPRMQNRSGNLESSQASDSDSADGKETRPTVNNVVQQIVETKAVNQTAHDKLVAKAKMKRLGARATQGLDPEQLIGLRRKLYDLLAWQGFDMIIGVIIACNGLTIGLEARYNAQIPIGCSNANGVCSCSSDIEVVCLDTPTWLSIADITFNCIYIIELGLRFAVFGPCVLQSHWLKLDAALVLIGTADMLLSWVAEGDTGLLDTAVMLRILRLARLARAVRLITLFKTLWLLVQGLLFSVNTLLWTVVLLFVLCFMLACFGCEIIQVDLDLPMDHPYNIAVKDNFQDLVDASLFMLQMMSWDSIASVYRPLVRHNPLLFLYIMWVLLIMAIALMNLVTAIMVDGSMENAMQDKEAEEALAAEEKKKQMEQLREMFLELDEDGSGELTMDEIEKAPQDMQDQLQEIAGSKEIQELFDLLDFDGGGSLAVDEFCEGVIKATTGAKPLELDKLVKQCSEILSNGRKNIAVLSGREDTSAASSANGSDSEDDNAGSHGGRTKHSPKTDVQSAVAQWASAMSQKVDAMDYDLHEIKQNVKDIMEGMIDTNFSKKWTHPGLKRAVAVVKGPLNHKHNNTSF
eukprot:TRINITY_DN7588_c0_g1_i1.p1 TRINITY_DN7588_c0_g1~~TRINITY_DN7588_c0_g1_i1.p1  ORF type:complete len:606 (-),score=84.99 TRINITY_DN7588_c0_g1_i1:166-1983(-)